MSGAALTLAALDRQRSDDGARYGVRQLEGAGELVASYRLRYEVYESLGYARPSRAGIELDEYDSYAVPFGAFDRESGALVGTLRLVTNEIQPDYAQVLSRTLHNLGDDELTRQASRPRSYALPSIVSREIGDEIGAFNVARLRVEELSRTIVHPDRRGAGISRALMELGLAYAARRGPVVLVGGCLAAHVPMYAKYGYRSLSHGRDFFDSVGQLASAVVCRTDALPEPTRANVDHLLSRMTRGPTRNEEAWKSET